MASADDLQPFYRKMVGCFACGAERPTFSFKMSRLSQTRVFADSDHGGEVCFCALQCQSSKRDFKTFCRVL